jgi:hypothetical protein
VTNNTEVSGSHLRSIPAEVAFDRAVRERLEYSGRYDIDPDMDPLLGAVYTLTNELYKSHSDGTLTIGDKIYHLHFDFIDGRSLNAHAFTDGDYAFIGLTVSLVREFEKLGNRLVRERPVWELLADSAADEDQIAGLSDALVIVMVQFVAFHELAHHILGHVSGVEDARCFQVGELDADRYAIETIAENLLSVARPEFLEMIGRQKDEQSDSSVLTLITLAVGVCFFRLIPANCDPPALGHTDHPPSPVRLRYVISSLRDWLSSHRPGSDSWVDEHYFQVMDRGTRALDRDDLGESWNVFTDYLEGVVVGREHLDLLEKRRRSLLESS